jgi:site-specific DNA recombinase
VRHPRVAVALEDALDVGDTKRDSKSKVEIRDATGAVIDRFTLSIKATIWREENKRRAERVRMGKMATLDQGYWPGTYRRLGYKMRRGPRGRIIEIAEDEVPTVLTIFEMYDAGVSIRDIRRHLIRSNASQKGYMARIHEWDLAVIYRILNAEDYTGTATWHFGDGLSMSIEIPQIVPHELWERVQARLERNKRLSPRNAKHVYVLQGLLYCGDCGRAMHARQKKFYYRNGERRAFKTLVFE